MIIEQDLFSRTLSLFSDFWERAWFLWQRSRGIFHVRGYGARGEGMVDEIEFIEQAALDAIAYARRWGTGAKLVFEYGQYFVSRKVRITESAVEIEGAGGGRELWTKMGTWVCPTADFPDGEAVFSFDPSEGTHSLFGNKLSKIAIVAPEQYPLTNVVHGIHWGVAKGIIDDVYVLGVSGRGLGIQGYSTKYKGYDSHISRSSFRKCGTHGIEFLGACSDIWFHEVKSEGNVNGSGLEGLGANCYYLACHFTGNKNNIRNVGGATEILLLGCNMETPEEHNLDLTVTSGGISRLRIIGCQIDCNRLSADGVWDAIFIGSSAGNYTCSGVIMGNTFAASDDICKPRHLINISNKAGFQLDIAHNTWAKSVYRLSAVNHAAAATRCLLNGMGRNGSFDPNVAGEWFGYGEDGIHVVQDLPTGPKIFTSYNDVWIG